METNVMRFKRCVSSFPRDIVHGLKWMLANEPIGIHTKLTVFKAARYVASRAPVSPVAGGASLSSWKGMRKVFIPLSTK